MWGCSIAVLPLEMLKTRLKMIRILISSKFILLVSIRISFTSTGMKTAFMMVFFSYNRLWFPIDKKLKISMDLKNKYNQYTQIILHFGNLQRKP